MGGEFKEKKKNSHFEMMSRGTLFDDELATNGTNNAIHSAFQGR